MPEQDCFGAILFVDGQLILLRHPIRDREIFPTKSILPIPVFHLAEKMMSVFVQNTFYWNNQFYYPPVNTADDYDWAVFNITKILQQHLQRSSMESKL